MLKKLVLLCLCISIFITGCQVEDIKDNAQLQYDYSINTDDDYKNIHSQVIDNRTLYVKLKEDNTLDNLGTALHNRNVNNQADYTAYKYGNTTEIYEKGQEKEYKVNNYTVIDLNFVYLDSMTYFTGNIYDLYKNRPVGWKDKINNGLKYYSVNKNRSNVQTETTFILYTNTYQFTENDRALLLKNVLLEDSKENRYKASKIVIAPDKYRMVITYPYAVKKSDPFIKLKIFNIVVDREIELTWNL